MSPKHLIQERRIYNADRCLTFKDEDLGTGSAFGFSVGKYLTDSFRLELEAIKRTGYEMDTTDSDNNLYGSKYYFQKYIY